MFQRRRCEGEGREAHRYGVKLLEHCSDSCGRAWGRTERWLGASAAAPRSCASGVARAAGFDIAPPCPPLPPSTASEWPVDPAAYQLLGEAGRGGFSVVRAAPRSLDRGC